jgi:group I intron endonuclease
MIKNDFYVYAHFTPEGDVFYIGKGRGNRAYKKSSRNPHWRNKVAKHGGFIVSILQDQLDEELAFEVEKSFIESIGRGNLVNLTEGGEGISGHNHSEETRKKIGDGHRGEKNFMFGKKHSEETLKKQSEIKIGKYDGKNNPNYGKFGKDSPCAKKVNQYTKSGEFIKTWDCRKDIERELKISGSSISACCLNKRKSAGGFLWRYAD